MNIILWLWETLVREICKMISRSPKNALMALKRLFRFNQNITSLAPSLRIPIMSRHLFASQPKFPEMDCTRKGKKMLCVRPVSRLLIAKDLSVKNRVNLARTISASNCQSGDTVHLPILRWSPEMVAKLTKTAKMAPMESHKCKSANPKSSRKERRHKCVWGKSAWKARISGSRA